MKPNPGRLAYESVACEQPIDLVELDPETVRYAQEYAKRAHQKWPPKPLIDVWQMQIRSH